MSVLGKMPTVINVSAVPTAARGDSSLASELSPGVAAAAAVGAASSYALVQTQGSVPVVDPQLQMAPLVRLQGDIMAIIPAQVDPFQVQQAGFEIGDALFYGGVMVGGGLALSATYVIGKRFFGWLIDKSFRQSHDIGSARDAFCVMVLDYNKINKKTEPSWVSRFFKKGFVVSRGLLATVRRAIGIKRKPEDDIKTDVDKVIRQHWPEAYSQLGNIERMSQQLAGKLGPSPNRERPFPSLSLSDVYGDRADGLPDWIVTRLYNKDMTAVNQYRELTTIVMQRFRNAVLGVQVPANAGSDEMMRITQGIERAREQSEQYIALLEELKAANQGLKTVLNDAGKGYIVSPAVDRAWFSIIRDVEPKIDATLEFLNPRQARLDEAVSANSLPPTTDLYRFSTIERLLNSVVEMSRKPASVKGVELILDTETLEKIGFIGIPTAVQPLLSEALTTIVDNAIAHSSPRLRFDGARADIAACTGVHKGNNKLYVTVTDNGLGIDSMERVKAESGPLSQVLQLAEEQDGIRIHHKALKSLTRGHYGTKFTITIDLPDDDASPTGSSDPDSMLPWSTDPNSGIGGPKHMSPLVP